ncbi:MAG TPA: ferrichrome ABC transporter permease [Myxococcales bacterium]|nr:ferrichrome ABC transporter permease [Myxococcales bacterium]
MPLFASVIVLSAFLLFLVQPLIGRVVLPWFGGTPAVWTTCMLFFQVLLLAGYGYSHLLAARLRAGRQARLHALLLAAAALALGAATIAWGTPLIPGPDWRPADSAFPTLRVLALLSVSVGLPYLVLSTTGPLLQAWFCRAFPGRPVYRLYALSNLGSILALLSYPFILEPLLPVGIQAWGWAVGFGLFAAGALACALFVARLKGPPSVAPEQSGDFAPTRERPKAPRFALWTLLAAAASVMLLAVTNQLCQEIAVVPFLWIAPLVLYLLSFVLCFESTRWYTRRRFLPALFTATGLAIAALHLGPTANLGLQLGAYLLLLFCCAMVCHGELAALKPPPQGLTGFYFALALGGALGGVLVGLVAPRVFKGLWELHLGLGGTWLLVLVAPARDRGSALWGRHGRLARWGLASAVIGLLGFLALNAGEPLEGARWSGRSFYGRLAVTEVGGSGEQRRFELRHGPVVHGLQFAEGPRRALATTYYGPDSGVGLALRRHPRRLEGAPLRVGVVGLGVGTLAAYGRPGDRFRFYEINPEVIRLARGDGGFFGFLAESAATIEVVEGDARISLERELRAGEEADLDLLVLDAFSSDSIPVHLLTREALASYLARLAPGGVIAVHVSNLFLDLSPVVARLAAAFGLSVAIVESNPPPSADEAEAQFSSEWMLLSRSPLSEPELAAASRPARERPGRGWTDDFSNLFETVVFSRRLLID